MNKIGKAGAILTIIGGALMIFIAIVLFFGGTTIFTAFFASDMHPEAFTIFYVMIIIIAVIDLILGILDIVFASLALRGKSSFRVAAGVFAIISIFFGFTFYFIPSILFLVGGILILCGKKEEEQVSTVTSSAIGVKTVS